MLSPFFFNRISTLYAQLLTGTDQTETTTDCSIKIGYITGTLTSNCIIEIRNVCSSSNDSLRKKKFKSF